MLSFTSTEWENPSNFKLTSCVFYATLPVGLSPLFPETLMLGMEIRLKVSDYVQKRVEALRLQHPGQYTNIACIRSNAMKHLPNFFGKAQVCAFVSDDLRFLILSFHMKIILKL